MSTLGWMILFCITGMFVAAYKGRGVFRWGMICGFLPFVGLFFLLILPRIAYCPDCAEQISPKAKVCPHCVKDLRQ